MTGTWLAQFAANIDAMKASSAAVQSESPMDVANRYLSMKDAPRTAAQQIGYTNAAGQSSGGGASIGGALSNAGKGILSGAGWLLDKAERPMEGIANSFDYGVKQNNLPDAQKDSGWDMTRNNGAAFLRGFMGQDKTTYSKVLEDAGVTNNLVKGVGGFIGDVALDPLTYVGPGAVKGAFKLGAKLTGQTGNVAKLAEYALSKNKLGTEAAAELNPIAKATNDIATAGTTTVPTSAVAKVTKALGDKASAVNSAEALSPVATDAITPISEKSGAHFRAQAAHDSIKQHHDAMTNGIETLRYPASAEISPLHISSPVKARAIKEVSPLTPAAVEPVKAADVAAQSVEHANPAAISKPVPFNQNKLISEHLAQFESPATKGLEPDASKLSIFNRVGGKAQFTNARVVKGADASMVSHIDRLTIGRLIKNGAGSVVSKSTSVPQELEGLYLKQGDKLVEIDQVVKKGITALRKAQKAGTQKGFGAVTTSNTAKLIEAAPKAAAVVDPALETSAQTATRVAAENVPVKMGPARRLNAAGQAQWVKDHPHIEAADLKYIVEGDGTKIAQSAANTNERMIEVLNRSKNVDYGTIKELGTAIDAGKITEEGMAVHNAARDAANTALGKSGPGDSWSTFDTKLKAAQTRLSKFTAGTAEADKAAADVKALEAAKESLPAVEQPIINNPEVAKAIDARLNASDAGDNSWANRPMPEINDLQKKGVAAALKNMNYEQFGQQIKNPSKFKFETNLATPTNTQGLRDAGKIGNIQAANKMAQMNLSTQIHKSAEKIIKTLSPAIKINTPEWSAAMYDNVLPMLNTAENVIRSHGVDLILGRSKFATGLPVSTHDVLSALPRDFVESHYFSGTHDFSITQLLDIGNQYVRASLGQMDKASVKLTIEKYLVGAWKDPSSKMTAYLTKLHTDKAGNLATIINNVDSAFTEATPALMTSLMDNSIAATVKVGEDTVKLSQTTIQGFHKAIDENATVAEMVNMAANTRKIVTDAAQGLKIPPGPESINAAHNALVADMATTFNMPQLMAVDKATKAFARATTKQEMSRVGTKVIEDNAVAAENLGQEMLKAGEIDTLDLGTKAELNRLVSTARALAPHLGNSDLRPIFLKGISVNQSLATDWTSIVNDAAKGFSNDELSAAFNHLSIGGEAVEPAQLALQKILGTFDQMAENNGVTKDALLHHLELKHFPNFLKINPTDIGSSWKTWESKDILTDLSKFNAGMREAIAHAQIGREISKFGENVFRPGTVKIIDHGGRSPLAALIDTSKFYPEHIARQMHMLDTTLKELADKKSSGPLLRLLDSAMHSYKAGLTIYNPQHHVRNMVGDMWLSSMDGVKAGSYKKSWAAMAVAKDQYKDFDTLKALETAYIGGNSPEHLVSFTFGGKQVHLSPTEVYQLAHQSSVLKKYSVIEDISQTANEADRVASTLKKYSPLRMLPGNQGGKLHNLAAGVSETREHYVRMAHFISALEDGAKHGKLKGTDLQDALKNLGTDAARRVNKWHPDGSDMSMFEKSTMRRTVLFYSWIRKAIPLVVESATMRPGKFLAWNKAMYNTASANGIDLKGYGDPFPTDQLFPSYIADSVQGPIFGKAGAYVGIKPGVPSLDIPDQYFSNPQGTLRTILGSTNPLYKVPFEVGIGANVGTGSKIMDKSEYVDSQVPYGNMFDKVTGRSLTTPWDATRVAPANTGYTGNPTNPMSPKMTAFFNWLSGMSVTDYSKPSSGVSAQRENKRITP